MKYEVGISGKTRIVEVEQNAEGWQAALDGEAESIADVVETTPNTFSVLLAGKSHGVSVTASADGKLNLQSGRHEFTAEVNDPRSWRGRRQGGVKAEGPQQVVAPMPGKVIRVLVRAGAKVQADQGLLVVEAMKMQNEIRSAKSGTVEQVMVTEGQAVNAGEVLCVVA